jgi:hypothetical protein
MKKIIFQKVIDYGEGYSNYWIIVVEKRENEYKYKATIKLAKKEGDCSNYAPSKIVIYSDRLEVIENQINSVITLESKERIKLVEKGGEEE